MEKKQQYQINISGPNLANICINEKCNGELSGKLYHCYTREAIEFSNVVELVRYLEQLFDSISFPQASTRMRSFVDMEGQKNVPHPPKVVSQEEIIGYTGHLGTFILLVKFRQNSTWQGEIFWMEKGVRSSFSNTLDFIKLLDNAIEASV